MNRTASVLLSLTLLLSFFVLPLKLAAQTNFGRPPQAPPGATAPAPVSPPKDIPESVGSTVVATVNIKNSMILSQYEGVFDIGFTISNRVGIQAGVRYGVKLVAESPRGQVVVDEYVYDDMVTLLENDVVHKKISYTAPQFLSGTYQLYLTSSNQSGFPFGSTFVGTVLLTATKKGVSIDVNSCTMLPAGQTLAIPTTQAAVVDAGQVLKLTCTATHTGEGTLPTVASFETRYATAYGEKLPPAAEGAETVVFANGETKTFSVVLPRLAKPGLYHTKVTLLAGPVVSNPIIVRTIMKGRIATIDNVSFDKEAYKKGDTANLSLLWYGTVGSPNEDPATSAYLVEASMRSEHGKECAEPFSQEIGITKRQPTALALAIGATCTNPIVTVSLRDPDGKTIYDTKEFALAVEKAPISPRAAMIVALAVALLAIIAFAMKHRSKRGGDRGVTPSVPTTALFLFVFLGSIALAPNAHADTFQGYSISGSGDIIRSTVNLDKGTYPPYTPGEAIQATAEMTVIPANSWSTGGYSVRMDVVHDNANTRGQYSPASQILPNPSSGWSVYVANNQSTGLHTYSGFTAWPIGTPGPYSVQFRASFQEYGSWWWAGNPYDIYYTVEATPANRVDIMGDQYGIVFNGMPTNGGANYEYYTFNADLIGSFPNASMRSWGLVSGPSNSYYNGPGGTGNNTTQTFINSGFYVGYVSPPWQPGTYRIGFSAMDVTGAWRSDYANLYLTAAPQSLPNLISNNVNGNGPYWYGYPNGSGYFPTGSEPMAQNTGSLSTGAGFYVFAQTATGAGGEGTITDHPAVWANALSPGQSWSTLNYNTSGFPTTPGTFSLRHCVDKSSAGNAGVIVEYNENDNCTPWGTGTITSTACSDGVDNDGDGLADGNDPGCVSYGVPNPGDNDETDPTQCSDGIDNADAEDSLADNNDSGCRTDGVYDPSDNDETYIGPVYQCSDGVDNNDEEDALVDTLDPGCHSDGDAGNAATYEPDDDDEADKKRPIFIDF